MPRFSEKRLILRDLIKLKASSLYNELDDDEQDVIDNLIALLLLTRNLNPADRYVSAEPKSRFEWIGATMSPRQFRFNFRMERSSFLRLVGIIEHHEVFRAPVHAGRHRTYSVDIQLAAFLKVIGFSGNGASPHAIAIFLGCAEGSVFVFFNRALRAITELLKFDGLRWPDENARAEIKARILQKFRLPGCVGAVDGTLFPFDRKPEITNAEDFFDRKCNYSLNSIIVNDDRRKILFIHLGWPGSVHDNRSMNTSTLRREHQRFLNPGEWIAGDSAFEAHPTLIPVYKKTRSSILPEEHEAFNTILSRFRVTAEHTIGILKGRFQCLKTLRFRLRHRNDMLRIIQIIMSTAILHNLLIEEPDCESWFQQDDPDLQDTDPTVQTNSETQNGEAFRQTIMQSVLGLHNI